MGLVGFFLVNFSHSEIKSSSDSFTALSQKIAIIVQGNICCINWVINYTVNHSYNALGLNFRVVHKNGDVIRQFVVTFDYAFALICLI